MNQDTFKIYTANRCGHMYPLPLHFIGNPVCLEHFVPHLHLYLVQSTCDQIRQMLDPGVNEVLDSDIITQTHKNTQKSGIN